MELFREQIDRDGFVVLPGVFDAGFMGELAERLERALNDGKTGEAALASEEGIFCGISAGGACAVALRISREVENATIVFVVCDRGDRYLSTGVFPG